MVKKHNRPMFYEVIVTVKVVKLLNRYDVDLSGAFILVIVHLGNV